MVEDNRTDAEGPTSRNREGGLGVHVRGGSLQPGEDEKSAGQLTWCRMSQGRSVPARGQSGQNAPQLQALTCLKSSAEGASSEFGIMRVADFSKIARFSASC